MGKNRKLFNQEASSFLRLFGGGGREFCEHTPIHGIPYVGQGDRTLKERLIWVVILSVAITSCCYLIRSRYIKWEKSPVLVNFKEEPLNVWDVPLPSVTICPDRLNIYKPSDVYGVQDYTVDCLNEGLNFVDATMCYEHRTLDYSFTETTNCTPQYAFKINIDMCVPEEEATFQFGGKTASADILLTELGICYTFNSYQPSDIFTDEVMTDLIVLKKANLNRRMDWTLSKGYTKKDAEFPFRSFSPGIEEHILAQLPNSSYTASCDVSPFTGYTITLHLPIEYPSLFKEPINVAEHKMSYIAVKPKFVFAGEDVKSLPSAKRGCLFDDENPLRFFKFYSDSNCDVECLTNYTFKTCGCVSPYMLRGKEMELCTSRIDMNCARNASEALLTYEFNNRNIHGSCNCLPNCNSLVYEYMTVDLNLPSIQDNETSEPEEVQPERAKLIALILQSESLIWATKRTKYTTLVDFLADCGGLMGLCMGISIVSIIEILYHCTIRCVGRTLEEPETLQKLEDNKTRVQNDAEDVTELKPFTEK